MESAAEFWLSGAKMIRALAISSHGRPKSNHLEDGKSVPATTTLSHKAKLCGIFIYRADYL